MNETWIFKHGLGDSVQLSIVTKHLDLYRPDWQIFLDCHDCFRCLHPKKYNEDRNGTKKDIQFRDTRERWHGFPSTKATKLLRQLGIMPDTDLWDYEVPKLTSDIEVPNEKY